VVGLIVLLAAYVSVGRLLATVVVAYQDDILRELNYRLPFAVDARQVSGQWHSFTPSLVLKDLRLTSAGSDGQPIELREGQVDLDVGGSLRTWSPQLSGLRLAGLNLKGEWTADGRLVIRGFGGGDAPLAEWLQEFLLNLEQLALDNISLDVTMPDGELRQLEMDARLSREGSRRWLQASLHSTRGTQISALAEGVGNPFDPGQFRGDLYLKLDSRDLGAVREVFAEQAPGFSMAGGLSVELWSSWEQGVPSAQMRVTGEDLLFGGAGQDWQLLLDRLSFVAEVVERKDRLRLVLADLEIDQDNSRLNIPGLQLDVQGETVAINARGIPLGPLGKILASDGFLAERAAGVIDDLQPQGELGVLRLNVADISEPLRAWQLQADFEQLEVQAWHGAPGVTAARGFVSLAPGGGYVVLDSQQFSMDFPTIYKQPLLYDDFHGTINIGWDAQAVTLHSGLVTAHGVEGVAKVLFGLNIPLQPDPVGLEMDLLVGLQSTHSRTRAKYVPDILNSGLRDWLRDSIGEGVVNEAGFLWRGSLTGNSPQLHTVQLFFDIEDTTLSYHPAWPPLTDLDGILFINDSDVSVWSEHARLFDSLVERLSVELWLDEAGEIILAVDGQLEGPAADGLAVINGAVIGEYVGQAFADWRLSGPLETQLSLLLNLNNADVAPQVAVTTRWRDVDLDIDPGRLPLRGINGTLDYSTTVGLSSDELTGSLWGQALSATVSQAPGNISAVQVGIDTTADFGELRRWLNLDLLEFARGRSAANVTIEIPPGAPPLLTIRSDLAGVSLDLPPPWNKAADSSKALTVTVQPGAESILLGVDLDGEVKLDLDLRDGQLAAAALGFYDHPAELVAGSLQIGGELPVLDTDNWRLFLDAYLDTYLVAPEEVPAQEQLPANPGQADTKAPGTGLTVAVQQLLASQLRVAGVDLGRTEFTGELVSGQWWLSASNPWLQGRVRSVGAGAPLQVDISMLDLAGLEGLQLGNGEGDGEGEPAQPIELPDMRVELQGLRQADRPLGGLGFALGSQDGVMAATDITGEIVGLQVLASQPAQLRWYQSVESHTELQAQLHFKDLGSTLEQLGYQKILETEEGVFDLELAWPGGPQDFSLPEGHGALRLDIGQGGFLEASTGASGALRVVSILNLAEIVRRLSLSHMFESGIPFNEMDGELLLDDGVLEVSSLDVQGGASSFHFSGESVLADRTLDGELIVTLPVANNLPWVAALAAGLPVAAGVFVLSKVFEKQVNRLTSAVYTTTGSWDDPQVKFDRVFDDSPAESEKASAPAATPPDPNSGPQSSAP